MRQEHNTPVDLIYRRLLSPEQQKIFENYVAKEESAHDEQFPVLPQCFQLYSMGILFICADLLYVGNGNLTDEHGKS